MSAVPAREAATAAGGEESDEAEEEEARVAEDSGSDSSGSESGRDEDGDGGKENAPPRSHAPPVRTWRGRFRIPAFQQTGTATRMRASKRQMSDSICLRA